MAARANPRVKGWYIPNVSRSREFRHVAFDANFWKTFIHARLATLPGDKGALTLFGKKPEHHRLFAEHVADAETYVVTAGQGRTVHEWRPKPSKPDNHWSWTRGSGKGSEKIGREGADEVLDGLASRAPVLERMLPLPGLRQRRTFLEVH